MSIQVKEIKTKSGLRKFVKFQLELYKNHPYFVPPLISEQVNDLDVNKNPVLKDATPYYFMAFKNGKTVGRIAAFINHYEVNTQQIKKIRFGHFDVIDDIEVSRALFDKVNEIAKANGLEYMEGPMGTSNLETAGMLTEGFDQLGTSIALYNYDYYPKHLEQLGFEKEKEWVEFRLVVPDSIDNKIYRFANMVTERYKLKIIHFKNKKDIKPYIKPVFDLIDESHHILETFVPVLPEHKEYYAKKYTKILNPEYMLFIEDSDGKLCAFSITLPTYAKALQKAKGSLLPFGWYHLLQSQRKNDTCEFVLIGVHPSFQRKGITSIIFKEAFETFKKNNIKFLETNPELVDNQSVQALWADYKPVLHKRRKSFRKLVE